MELIDTHVMIDSIGVMDMEAMGAAGITALVSDAAGGMDVATSSEAAVSFFERTLAGETRRAAEYFIDVYVTIGINMFAIPPDYERILEMLPRYLGRERVAAVGEVGMDPRSKTCPDLDMQKAVLKAQLRLAKEFDKTVVLHLPPAETQKWIGLYLELIDDAQIRYEKVVMAHADGDTTKMIADHGCIAQISTLPMRGITPEDAARIVVQNDLSRVLVSSDTRLRHRSDPLAVPRTAFQMRRLGISHQDIKKVFYDNPKRIYGLS